MTSRTDTLRELDHAHAWHPFCQMREFVADDAPIIDSANGFELIDTDGRRYLDGVLSLWCNVQFVLNPVKLAVQNACRDAERGLIR